MNHVSESVAYKVKEELHTALPISVMAIEDEREGYVWRVKDNGIERPELADRWITYTLDDLLDTYVQDRPALMVFTA